MNKTDIGFKKIVDQEVTGEQYVVFRFNINDKELTDWVISKISDVEKVSTETKPAPNNNGSHNNDDSLNNRISGSRSKC